MPAPVITFVNLRKLRRGRPFRVSVSGTNLPPLPATYIRLTRVGSGETSDITTYTVYSPTLMYIWGVIPRTLPRGWYNLTVNFLGDISTITYAFRLGN
jgi:hypothetical protein